MEQVYGINTFSFASIYINTQRLESKRHKHVKVTYLLYTRTFYSCVWSDRNILRSNIFGNAVIHIK